MINSPPETEWMPWGECVKLCASRGISRKIFVKMSKALTINEAGERYAIERRRFVNGQWRAVLPSDAKSEVRASYRRADLLRILNE